MKKLLYLALAGCLGANTVSAQQIKFGEGDTDITDKVQVNIGLRTSMDGGIFFDDYTPLKSGANLSEARIRLGIKYEQWDAYYDVDFGFGKITQKDAYIRYNFSDFSKIRLGYATEAFSMSKLTSQGDMRFITRPGVVNALAPGRSLGISYKNLGEKYYTETGVYTESIYNKQEVGSQGFSAAGRYLFVPVNNDNLTVALGAGIRFKKFGAGTVENDVFTINHTYGTSLESNVDTSVPFLNANVKWADQEISYNAQALMVTPKFFVQGEYIGTRVKRDRPDRLLFENQLGGIFSWDTFESWQSGNPEAVPLNFKGGYVEMGYMLKGGRYNYNSSNALLGTFNGKNAIELVARYSYTSLNDIKDGDIYWKGQDKFFPEGSGITDYPRSSPSIAGGIMHSATVGLNYNFNSHIRAMLEYNFNNIDNYRFEDKNVSLIQMRVQYKF